MSLYYSLYYISMTGEIFTNINGESDCTIVKYFVPLQTFADIGRRHKALAIIRIQEKA